ncbi:flagellar protein FlaG [Paenibacillus cellulosilyticus]|uniref:Flagellar protein FlaG n=1 Tax=Paenibacillus cellulosilyticus TaxID=375489 RepID=A0A2V2YZD2_9BACL|nr:flagellar protein FlaG [Paenibacillus cellulosilyticus]PWW08353.1 flagellar protein FlaG [Paenibacillus cellulosilyticus]QKS47951.1 flagellar protein FlaG [Paenibacillus cellulosilyticus]
MTIEVVGMTMNISSINTTAGYTTENLTGSAPAKDNSTAKSEPNGNEAAVAAVGSREQRLTSDIKSVLESLQGQDTKVERTVHEETNHIVYKVLDKESGKVLREIPEEKLLDMAAKMMELNGLLLDHKV